MKFLVIFSSILLLCALASPLYGEIYSWTGAKGVMHFTNYHPPPEAIVFIKDIIRPRHEADIGQKLEVEPEQPTVERREFQEDYTENFEEAITIIEEFERTLEDAEVLNQGLEQRLRVANQKAEAALVYAEELEYKIREVTSLPSSNTDYLDVVNYYPVRFKYGRPVRIHKPRFKQKRFHIKRHSIGRHFKKSPKRFHHKILIGKSRFSIPHSFGILNNRHLGSRHVTKLHGIGVRSNARFGHRHFRK